MVHNGSEICNCKQGHSIFLKLVGLYGKKKYRKFWKHDYNRDRHSSLFSLSSCEV